MVVSCCVEFGVDTIPKGWLILLNIRDVLRRLWTRVADHLTWILDSLRFFESAAWSPRGRWPWLRHAVRSKIQGKINAISTQDSKYLTAIHASRLIEISRKLVNLTRSDIDNHRIQLGFFANS